MSGPNSSSSLPTTTSTPVILPTPASVGMSSTHVPVITTPPGEHTRASSTSFGVGPLTTREKVIKVVSFIFALALVVGLTYAGLPVWAAALVTLGLALIVEKCKKHNPVHQQATQAPAIPTTTGIGGLNSIAATEADLKRRSNSPTPLQKALTLEPKSDAEKVYQLMLSKKLPLPKIFFIGDGYFTDLDRWYNSIDDSDDCKELDEIQRKYQECEESEEKLLQELGKALQVHCIYLCLARYLREGNIDKFISSIHDGADEKEVTEHSEIAEDSNELSNENILDSAVNHAKSLFNEIESTFKHHNTEASDILIAKYNFPHYVLEEINARYRGETSVASTGATTLSYNTPATTSTSTTTATTEAVASAVIGQINDSKHIAGGPDKIPPSLHVRSDNTSESRSAEPSTATLTVGPVTSSSAAATASTVTQTLPNTGTAPTLTPTPITSAPTATAPASSATVTLYTNTETPETKARAIKIASETIVKLNIAAGNTFAAMIVAAAGGINIERS